MFDIIQLRKKEFDILQLRKKKVISGHFINYYQYVELKIRSFSFSSTKIKCHDTNVAQR